MSKLRELQSEWWYWGILITLKKKKKTTKMTLWTQFTLPEEQNTE